MATRRSSSPEQTPTKLNPAERRFWQGAFLAAELPLLHISDGKRLSTMGAAHLCADFADAALDEYRRRITWRQT